MLSGMLLLMLSGFVLTESLPTPKPTLNPDKFVQTVWNPIYPFNYEVPPLLAYVHAIGQLKNITFGNPYADLERVVRGSTAYWPVQYCGVHFVNKGEGYILSDRAFDYQPTQNLRCVWGFVGDNFCTPRIECPEFQSTAGASCRSNYVQITDGGASFIHHFCDDGARSPRKNESYIAKDGVLDVVFRYSNPLQRPKFTCWVSCDNYPVKYTVSGSNALGSKTPLTVKVHPPPQTRVVDDTLPAPKISSKCNCGVVNTKHAASTNGGGARSTTSPLPSVNRTQRVVGGRVTLPSQYPWMVGLLSKEGKLPYCGAVLVSAEYIITAQHCVEDEDLEDIIVVLNEHDFYNETEGMGAAVRRGVVEVINYPYYMESTFSGDIALLRLSRPVLIAQPQFTPVCLPPPTSAWVDFSTFDRASAVADGEEKWVGSEVLAMGWGTTHGGPGASKSPKLLEVPLVVLPNQACNDYHSHDPPEPPQVMDNMLCAGYAEGGRDTCAGDSGGPLIGLNKSSGKYATIGVTSWGFGCAIRLNPGVFSRVSAFMYWIRMHTVDGHFCE